MNPFSKRFGLATVLAVALSLPSYAGVNRNADNLYSIQAPGGTALVLPTSGGAVLSDTSSVTVTGKTMSGSSNTFTNIPAATAITGQLPIANGGTNATTAAAAATNLLEDATKSLTAGSNAGAYNTTALSTDNFFLGDGAGQYMAGTAAGIGDNIFIGTNAGAGASGSPSGNTAIHSIGIGKGALASLTTAQQLTAIGFGSQGLRTTGNASTSVGYQSLAAATTGNFNAAFGGSSQLRMIGSQNSSFGESSMLGSTVSANNTGSDNNCFGISCLNSLTSGSYNMAFGESAGQFVTSGTNNTLVGYASGVTGNHLTTGAYNTLVGNQSAVGAAGPTLNYQTCLGASCVVNSANTVVLGRTTDKTVIGATADSGQSSLLQVNSTLQMIDGNQAVGKVITSDANGKGTWTALPLYPVILTDWTESTNAPTPLVSNNLRVYDFQSSQAQALYATLKVPTAYVAGKQIKLNMSCYSSSYSSGNDLMQSVATLTRTGTDAITSTTNQRTSTNAAVTPAGTAIPYTVTLDLTDTSGNINSVAVAAGHVVQVKFVRGTDTDTSDIYCLSSGEVTFQ